MTILLFGYLNFTAPRAYNQSGKLQGAPFFNSPDEAVNFWSAAQIAGGTLPIMVIPTELTDYKYLDPRSTELRWSEGTPIAIVPTGFLGFSFLAGIIAWSFFGILWLTPIAAAFAAWALFNVAKNFVGNKAATYSFFILTFLSPWLYYSMRGQFNNVLFTAFWLGGVACLARFAKKSANTELIGLLGSFLFFALAIFIRPSEASWIILCLIIFFMLSRHFVALRRGTLFIIGLGLVFIGTIYLNGVLRGGFDGGVGYSALGSAQTGIMAKLLPFGFHPRAIAVNIYHIFFLNLWWLTLPALGGLIILAKNNLKSRLKGGEYLSVNAKNLAFSIGAGFVWLIVLYGSWRTFDTPSSAQTITIGNAHMRYWLPIIIVFLPFAFYFIEYVSGLARRQFGMALRV